MSKAIQHLGTLYNNPFIFGSVLHTFYNALPEKEKNILLSYLVLPLTLYPTSQKYLLQKQDPRSSLRILASDHARIYGLQERIQAYRNVTNMTLQYATDIGTIKMNDCMSVEILSKWPIGFISPPNANKASERLARLMGTLDVPTIYRMLGVKSL
jgi:hypothetical protein